MDKDLIYNIYNNALLSEYSTIDKSRINRNTGLSEIYQAKQVKVFRGVSFCFHQKKLEILFKPHYYFNDNEHNANDFTALECIKTLSNFAALFGLPIDELPILNIEFGINALSPIDCKDLITFVQYHDRNPFQNTSDNLKYSKISLKYNKHGKGNSYKTIKFYAKGVQYPQHTNKNTFRFEVKSKRTNYIKSLGIGYYADLLKPDTYKTLSKNILAEFNNVLILDINNKMNNLNHKEHKKLNEYFNQITWYKTLQGSRNTFNNNKKKYFQLLDKTNCNIHETINKIISDKLGFLLEGCADLTPLTAIKNCAILSSSIMENCTSNLNEEHLYNLLPNTLNNIILTHYGV